jgi:hypothetical protein
MYSAAAEWHLHDVRPRASYDRWRLFAGGRARPEGEVRERLSATQSVFDANGHAAEDLIDHQEEGEAMSVAPEPNRKPVR